MHLKRLHLATRARRLTVLAVLATALTGCQSITGSQPFTQVRVIDASPDAPNLDIYQNAVVTLYDIGFGTASSYISINPGSWNFSVDVTTGRQQLANVIGTLAVRNSCSHASWLSSLLPSFTRLISSAMPKRCRPSASTSSAIVSAPL